MADDIGLDRRYLDLVIFADQFHVGVGRHGPAALPAMGWLVVFELIGIVGQPTIVRLMPGLRPAGTRVLAFLFLVGGRRLRRSSETFCSVVEAGSPAQSTRPCSGAANQSDPCAHGFRDWTPWQGEPGNQPHRHDPRAENGGG